MLIRIDGGGTSTMVPLGGGLWYNEWRLINQSGRDRFWTVVKLSIDLGYFGKLVRNRGRPMGRLWFY